MNEFQAITRALQATTQRYEALEPLAHTDGPHECASRVISASDILAMREQRGLVGYEAIVHLGALVLAWLVAVDRAEEVMVTSGCDGVSCSPGDGGCGCGRAA